MCVLPLWGFGILGLECSGIGSVAAQANTKFWPIQNCGMLLPSLSVWKSLQWPAAVQFAYFTINPNWNILHFSWTSQAAAESSPGCRWDSSASVGRVSCSCSPHCFSSSLQGAGTWSCSSVGFCALLPLLRGCAGILPGNCQEHQPVLSELQFKAGHGLCLRINPCTSPLLTAHVHLVSGKNDQLECRFRCWLEIRLPEVSAFTRNISSSKEASSDSKTCT